ncbi:MAG: hypothetical protein JOZ05_14275 [Acetobacteraceae bacterium]|nr:hypothetical protein [Acetobacteraceae bacterium]
MRPSFHPRLVNGRMGDPCVYLEVLHQPDAILLDCGDLSALSARHLLKIGTLAVSHAHLDHWAGFDQLLRVLVGRERRIDVVGPEGFAARLHHRLQAYTWNLVDRIPADLVFTVTEVTAGAAWSRARMRLHRAFASEQLAPMPAGPIVLRSGQVRLGAAVLDHGTPCLGFVLQEEAHYNVWRNRLDQRGLPAGPWLAGLKHALAAGRPDDFPVPIFARAAAAEAAPTRPLSALRDLVAVTRGQRVAYLTDFEDTEANRETAIALARNADLVFIEAPFLSADAAIARGRQHLTARAAGEIARAAAVRRIEPFHFSLRYAGREEQLLGEVAAFAGPDCVAPLR